VDICAYIAVLSVAYVSAWSARDFAWSTWICALAVTSFTTLALPFFWIPKQRALDRRSGLAYSLPSMIGSALAASAFLGGFFVFCFLEFFEVPAEMINRKFPLVSPDLVGETLGIVAYIDEAVRRYWPLIAVVCATRMQPIIATVSSSDDLVRAWLGTAVIEAIQCIVALLVTGIAITIFPRMFDSFGAYVMLAILVFPWKAFFEPGGARRAI
jgi:hypothetical protein